MSHARDADASDAETPLKKLRREAQAEDGGASPPSPRVEAPVHHAWPENYRINALFDGEVADSRTLLELRLLQGVGAVLDKPNWWLKWQQRSDVREKWLAEIERAFVERTFMAIFSRWPEGTTRGALLRSVRDAVAVSDTDQRALLLEQAFGEVTYRTKWPQYRNEQDEEIDEDSDEMWYDAESHERYAAALELLTERGCEIDAEEQRLRNLDPYGQLGWYVHQWSRIQRVQAVGADALTSEDVEVIFGRDGDSLERALAVYEDENDYGDVQDKPEHAVADQRDAREMADVVFALKAKDQLSVDIMREALGNPTETREDVLTALLQYTAMIFVELDAVRAFVVAYVDQVLHRCRLRLSDLEKGHNPTGITWGPVEETFVSDALISSDLKATFASQVRALEDVPEDQLDWHPRANEQVLDLVHPSLFCGVYGVTKRIPEFAREEIQREHPEVAHQLLPLMVRSETDGVLLDDPPQGPTHSSRVKFQWLPTEFEISEAGDTCRIRSYINNLHPADHGGLYDSIAQIFGQFVPLFERLLASLKGPVANVLITPADDLMERTNMGELPMLPSIPKEVQLNRPTVPAISLKGQRLQVIVKIAEIVLTPEKPSYSGGSWHIEGTKAEQIVATGIYYFTSDNVTDSQLAFRTMVEAPEYAQGDHFGVKIAYGVSNYHLLVQTLGAVTTSEDRCLVFPNVLQHKVQPFELVDKTKRGVRKILCFFLIDPSRRIPSTADVAPQQSEWIDRARRDELHQTPIAAAGVPEIVQQQIVDMAHAKGMTLEQAKAYRLELMDERSPSKAYGDGDDWLFSLCEH